MPETKIELKGKQLFNVPNTGEGILFKELCHKYLNTLSHLQFRFRGRGSRKGPGNGQSVPLEYSEWMAVYVSTKKWFSEDGFSYWPEDLYKYWVSSKKLNDQLRIQIKELKEEKVALREVIEGLVSDKDTAKETVLEAISGNEVTITIKVGG